MSVFEIAALIVAGAIAVPIVLVLLATVLLIIYAVLHWIWEQICEWRIMHGDGKVM